MARTEKMAHSAPPEAGFPPTAQNLITIRRALDREPGFVRRRDGSHVAYLSPEQHRQLWAGIQAQAPLLAAFIKGEIAQQLRDDLDAELVLERTAMKAFMESAK